MSPHAAAERGARAIEALSVILRDGPSICQSALGLGLLVVVILGLVFAGRHHRQREPRGKGGSVTDWGENLALVYELRRDIKRLSEENQRLWQERAELVKMFSRVVELLQQEEAKFLENTRGRKIIVQSRRADFKGAEAASGKFG